MTAADLHPVIARMVTAQPIPPGTPVDLTPLPTLRVEYVGRECRRCGALIPPTGQRGRPATRCQDCRPPRRAAA